MPRGKTYQEEPRPVKLLIPVGDATSKINDRIKKGDELKQRSITSEDELSKIRKEYYTWTEYNKELLTRIFSTDKEAREYAWIGGFSGAYHSSLAPKIKELHNDIDGSIRRLESVRDRLELIPLDDSITTINKLDKGIAIQKKFEEIFLVHGHDEGARELVARFIEKLKLKPTILHEQANEGKTIIEKLEKHSDVGYAIVLLTPDDEGKKKSESVPLKERARQNVILELGYFIGKLGRANVCALHKGSVEIPSDYIGVVFIPLDEAGGWQLRLAKEIKAAGFPIDMNDAVE